MAASPCPMAPLAHHYAPWRAHSTMAAEARCDRARGGDAMLSPTYVPAASFSLPVLVGIFNRAFAGYAVPIAQTEATLAAMIANNDVSLADSLVLLDGDEGHPI